MKAAVQRPRYGEARTALLDAAIDLIREPSQFLAFVEVPANMGSPTGLRSSRNLEGDPFVACFELLAHHAAID